MINFHNRRWNTVKPTCIFTLNRQGTAICTFLFFYNRRWNIAKPTCIFTLNRQGTSIFTQNLFVPFHYTYIFIFFFCTHIYKIYIYPYLDMFAYSIFCRAREIPHRMRTFPLQIVWPFRIFWGGSVVLMTVRIPPHARGLGVHQGLDLLGFIWMLMQILTSYKCMYFPGSTPFESATEREHQPPVVKEVTLPEASDRL